MFWEQSGVEATTAFSTAQGWPLDRACGVGLLTGMGLKHFTAPCDPPQTHIVEVSSTWPLDLALWVAEDRNLKGIEKGLTCLSFSVRFFWTLGIERLHGLTPCKLDMISECRYQ